MDKIGQSHQTIPWKRVICLLIEVALITTGAIGAAIILGIYSGEFHLFNHAIPVVVLFVIISAPLALVAVFLRVKAFARKYVHQNPVTVDEND